MTPRIELVFFEGCPHVEEARRRLAQALGAVDLPLTWDEWDTGLTATPATYSGFGSPSILVDGRDVSGGTAGSGMRCVVGGAPAVAQIVAAIERVRE